jgi:Ca-activated chloride channel family protein
MSLGHAELLWLLVLAPLAAGGAVLVWRRRQAALAAWAARGLWQRLGLDWGPGRFVLSVALLGAAVGGAALALARPRWGTIEETVERRGVDVVFVLDSSLSMAAADVAPSRLAVAGHLVRRLAGDLPGHRVALVQGEGDAVVLCPLTLDNAVLDLLLDTVEPAALPVAGTLLAPALEAALELFPESGTRSRVVVVVSDGEDQGSALDAAIARAAAAGVVVHAVGVGGDAGAPIPLGGDAGYKRDRAGRVVMTRRRSDTLEAMARRTGGVYLAASGLATELGPIVAGVERLEKRALEGQVLATQPERFQWPLAAAAVALLVHLAAPPLRGSREAVP